MMIVVVAMPIMVFFVFSPFIVMFMMTAMPLMMLFVFSPLFVLEAFMFPFSSDIDSAA